jgi:hypothetical protein
MMKIPAMREMTAFGISMERRELILFSQCPHVRHDIPEFIIVQLKAKRRHEARFTDRFAAALDDIEKVLIGSLWNDLAQIRNGDRRFLRALRPVPTLSMGAVAKHALLKVKIFAALRVTLYLGC